MADVVKVEGMEMVAKVDGMAPGQAWILVERQDA
jgi:hypothetical protein